MTMMIFDHVILFYLRPINVYLFFVFSGINELYIVFLFYFLLLISIIPDNITSFSSSQDLEGNLQAPISTLQTIFMWIHDPLVNSVAPHDLY